MNKMDRRDRWIPPNRQLVAVTIIIIGIVVVLTQQIPQFMRSASAAPNPLQGSATITLNPNTTYQTFQNWEATDFNGNIDLPTINIFGFNPPVMQRYRDVLADKAVNDLGLNRVRLEVMSGAENPTDSYTPYINGQGTRNAWKADRERPTNDNNDPNVINWSGFQFSFLDHKVDTVVLPMKQKLEARGEELYVNLNYVDFDASPFEHYNNPEEYAEFILATFIHLEDTYGWVPDAVEVILEPDNSSGWHTGHVGNALVAAAVRLNANGYTPDFIGPSTASPNLDFFDRMVQNVPAVLQHLTEYSYHCYNLCSDDSRLAGVASRAAQHGLRTSQLEHIGHTYLDLHRDLKLANVSAWAQYVLGDPFHTDPAGAYYAIDISDRNNPTVNLSSRAKFLRQYMKFIRPNAVRIQANTNNAAFDPVAFINANGKHVVVIKATAGGNISVRDLPAGTYGIKYTTDTICQGRRVLNYNVDHPDVTINAGGVINTNIPGCGVITVYAKTSSGPQPTATPLPTATPAAVVLPHKKLRLDGVNDRLQLNGFALAKNHAQRTIEMWIKGTGGVFYSEGDLSSSYRSQFRLGCSNSSTRLFVVQRDHNYNYLYNFNTPARVCDNNWHHIAATSGHNNELTIYVDGNHLITYTFNGFGTFPYAPTATGIGAQVQCCNPNGQFSRPFNGEVDEVRLWGTERSASQIAQYYNIPLPTNQRNNLEVYYTFDNANALGHDSSGHNRHGTLRGGGIQTASFGPAVNELPQPELIPEADEIDQKTFLPLINR